jgi:hypothetical protein
MAAIADLKVRFAVVRLKVCREGCLGHSPARLTAVGYADPAG